MTYKFFATPERYMQNLEEGRRASAIPALLNTPQGTVEPGIAIMTEGRARLVIPTHDAIRVATEIADVASAQRESASDETENE